MKNTWVSAWLVPLSQHPCQSVQFANENSAEGLREGWWREEQCREVLDRNYAKNSHTSYIEKAPRVFFLSPKMKNNLKVCSFTFFYTFFLLPVFKKGDFLDAGFCFSSLSVSVSF